MKRLATMTLCFSLLPFSAFAAQENVAGKTLLARGSVEATRDAKKQRLKRRSPIYVKDEISVGAGSTAQFRMIDNAVISLQEKSKFRIENYNYNTSGEKDSVLLNLISGGLRTITGAVGKDNKKAYQLDTPLATIGVRGTDYQVQLVPGGLYIGVWEGVISVKSKGEREPCDVELGKKRRYRFLYITKIGDCRGLDTEPAVFGIGADSQRGNDRGDQGDAPSSIMDDTLIDPDDPRSIPITDYPYQAVGIQTDNPSVGLRGTATDPAGGTPSLSLGDPAALYETDDPGSVEFTEDVGGYRVTWGRWGSHSTTPRATDNPYETPDPTMVWSVLEPTDVDIVQSRTGTATYDSVVDTNISGSHDSVDEFHAQFDVDFDSGDVDNGLVEIKTSTDNGEGVNQHTWNASFDGQVQNGELDLEMDQAYVSDVTNPQEVTTSDATGFIEGDFIGDNAEAAHGAFGFESVEDPSTHIEGMFILEQGD